MAASVRAALPDPHCVVILQAPTSVSAQKVRNPLHNASMLSVWRARAGLPGDDEGGGMLLPAFLSLTDRWPDGLSEEGIHLFFIKGTFLLDEFFRQLYAGNRAEDLIRHVLGLYVIGFAQHGCV